MSSRKNADEVAIDLRNGLSIKRFIAQRDYLLDTLQSIVDWTGEEDIPIKRRELLIRNAAQAALIKGGRG